MFFRDDISFANCASKVSYDYTDEEVKHIFDELEHQITCLRERFAGRKKFSLSESAEVANEE